LQDAHPDDRVRRRRSWYERRLRIQRTLIATAMLLLLLAACWQRAARFLALPTLHASSFLPESFWTRGDVRNRLPLMSHAGILPASRRGQQTYPYSVIPGGIRDAAELREMAARDYVVRRHFAGFDYHRARVIRAKESRAVYLSYRVRDRVFWTRKKVRLHAAELLLTDGKITARTRCGNQVSETPKSEVSDEEPAEDVLDQPVADIASLGPSLPFRFSEVRPNLPGADAIPPAGPQLFAGGFHFPFADFGVPIPKGACKQGDEEERKRCRHHHKPPAAPEPSTLLLIASGLAVLGWRYRHLRPVAVA